MHGRNSNNSRPSSPITTQEIEIAVSRYKSIETKRLALLRAMRKRPNDPQLKKVFRRLTGPDYIYDGVMAGIFINYGRYDEIFALELAERLNQMDIKVWLDLVNMDYQRTWHEEVHGALENSGIMLSVISATSIKNVEVRYEQNRFLKAGKLILPVLRERLDLAFPDYWLAPADFSRDFDRGFYNLMRSLQIKTAPV